MFTEAGYPLSGTGLRDTPKALANFGPQIDPLPNGNKPEARNPALETNSNDQNFKKPKPMFS